jgi:hypothetical protein
MRFRNVEWMGVPRVIFQMESFWEHDWTWIQWIPLLVSSSERSTEVLSAENDKYFAVLQYHTVINGRSLHAPPIHSIFKVWCKLLEE